MYFIMSPERTDYAQPPKKHKKNAPPPPIKICEKCGINDTRRICFRFCEQCTTPADENTEYMIDG